VIGSVVNDSGIAVFAAVALVGLPLLVASVAEAMAPPVVEPQKESQPQRG
jgi:hypothetical protein